MIMDEQRRVQLENNYRSESMRRITEAVSNSDGYVYLGNEVLALRDDEHNVICRPWQSASK